MSIPLYSDAVYFRVLQEELQKAGQAVKGDTRSLAFLFRNIGSIYGVKESGRSPARRRVSIRAGGSAAWPAHQEDHSLRQDRYLPPLPGRLQPDLCQRTRSAGMGELRRYRGVSRSCNLGRRRTPCACHRRPRRSHRGGRQQRAGRDAGHPGWRRVHDLPYLGTDSGGQRTIQLPVRVSGIWEPLDENEDFWFYRPRAFDGRLLIRRRALKDASPRCSKTRSR